MTRKTQAESDISIGIKAVRKLIGASQEVFAQLLAVSPMTIRSWEQGVRRPSAIATAAFSTRSPCHRSTSADALSLLLPDRRMLPRHGGIAPRNFRAGELNITESGNIVPDLIDEAAWLPRLGNTVSRPILASIADTELPSSGTCLLEYRSRLATRDDVGYWNLRFSDSPAQRARQ